MNPFTLLASVEPKNPRFKRDARILANAFASGRTLAEVWAILRYVNRCEGLDLCGYLHGNIFLSHFRCDAITDDPDEIEALRDFAYAWLEKEASRKV